MQRFLVGVICFLFLFGCEAGDGRPGGGGGGGGGTTLDGSVGNDGSGGGSGGSEAGTVPSFTPAVVSGRVWAPGNAPGLVMSGEEIPIFGALVRLSVDRQREIPTGAYCEQCIDPTGPYAVTDHRGGFEITGIRPGNYWLTIEKGQFRVETAISLTDGQVLEIATDATTLPSSHDPSNGRWMPHIALAAGSYDAIQDVLGKMGIGSIDSANTFVDGSTMNIDFFDNESFGSASGSMGSLTDLVSDLSLMMQYHIIFIPCSGSGNTDALQRADVLRNIRAYVEAGGKLYVTDWSGEWMDNVFPAFIELGGSGNDTPASAYDASSNTWNTSQFGNADGSSYDSNNARAVDMDLNTWLNGQMGPTIGSSTTSTYDPNVFSVEGNWNYIASRGNVLVGQDESGMDVYEEATVWVEGGEGSSTPLRPLTVTFEPVGCGRVLYSTYHTADNPHRGLVPQERILVFLIMQLGVCRSDPVLI